jgi:hypothetical protein
MFMLWFFMILTVGCKTVSLTSGADQLYKTLPAVEVEVPKLSWEIKEGRETWTQKVKQEINANYEAFDLSKDQLEFCPNYNSLLRPQRVYVWAEMVSLMAKYESSWNPATVFAEPPPLNVDSIGLLQLSYEDKGYAKFCDLSRKTNSLKNPIKNLECGVRIMAYWLKKDGQITSKAKNIGLARYWAVMRPLKKGAPRESFTKIKSAMNNLPMCKKTQTP